MIRKNINSGFDVIKFVSALAALLFLLSACDIQDAAETTEKAQEITKAVTEYRETEPAEGGETTEEIRAETEPETEEEQTTEGQTTAEQTTEEQTTEEAVTEPPAIIDDPKPSVYAEAYKNAGFLEFISENYGKDAVSSVKKAVSDKKYDDGIWYSLLSKSIYVLYDEYTGKGDTLKYDAVDAADGDVINLGFCGDISLDDTEGVMKRYVRNGRDITSLVSADLIELLKSFDIMTANSEFAASYRGKKLDKYYTYRGNPENVMIFHDIGVDFVSLANNHVYDYGLDAFLDTIQTMIDYELDFAGAGKNLAEASEPFFYVINGRKIAILCGSRAEKHYITPIAEENVPGVFGMYDSENMKKAVAKAKAESDFVIVFPHWGKENSYKIEDIIREQGHEYIDCGADLIVGCHAHQLQGIEFYKGKMIAYNLGNFLFENPDVKTGVLQVKIDPKDLSYKANFIPCIQDADHVWLCEGKERETVMKYMISISPAVKIDGDGNITEK